MENTSENKKNEWKKQPSAHLTLGILAHVDSGKTTLSEGILYLTGAIRKLGRVDHQDAFLDTYELEKARGITIFSKQAEFTLGEKAVTLLDTPGHVDFSPEMERTLQVLDYAVLVISALDGVRGQVRVLWKLLRRYEVPVFLFINKMDQPGADRERILALLQKELDSRCLDFGQDLSAEEQQENLAMCEEELLESYLEGTPVGETEIRDLIRRRKVFPCFFGSALKMQGVEEFLQGLERYTECPSYPEAFGARVFKISRDAQGSRLTWMKIIGGTLKVKTQLSGRSSDGEWEEKADQIRIYSGAGFRMVQEAEAGTVCAVTGLSHTRAGEGLGAEREGMQEILEPVLTCRLIPEEGTDPSLLLKNLRCLEEEEPMLHIFREEQSGEIFVQVMGPVQMEIIRQMMKERYGMRVTFGPGTIVYKETIRKPVEGVGHFEPLRHYAEVHLLLEPGEPGSGLHFGSACREDMLDRNWQRLILTHLEEKRHRGVLTGAEITDMKITLLAGRSHAKHTEGGDFRQATYRAVRQGLMMAESVLLEPVYDFRLEVPAENLGRALSDIQRMGGQTEAPESDGERAVVRGSVPAASLGSYQEEVTSYTRGQGRLFCTLKGYEPCHNAEEVIEEKGYRPEQDLENPASSVFCSHGAGTVIPWNQVRDYMHVDSGWKPEDQAAEQSTEETQGIVPAAAEGRQSAGSSGGSRSWKETSSRMEAQEKELQEIFARTYRTSEGQENAGAVPGWKRRRNPGAKSGRENTVESERSGSAQSSGGAAVPGGQAKFRKRLNGQKEKEYLLVDGYNVIFAWEELKRLAEASLDAARDKLMDVLSNYQGWKGCTLILVFDAYKVPGGLGEVLKYHNIYVVYTREAETADQYIEKTVHEIGRKYHVRVATSDALEQVIILGAGAERLSAAGLLEEVQAARQEIREEYLKRGDAGGGKNYLLDGADDELAETIEAVRLGKKEL